MSAIPFSLIGILPAHGLEFRGRKVRPGCRTVVHSGEPEGHNGLTLVELVEMQDLGYTLACVAAPCIIGGVMFLLFDLWDRRRRRAKSDDALPIIDYLI